RLGCRFPLTIDDADLELRRAEDLFGDRPDGQRLPRAGAGDDAEPAAGARQLSDARAVPPLEKGLDVKAKGELDGLARGTRRRDHDHAARRRLCPDEGVVVGQVWISDVSNHAPEPSKGQTCPADRGSMGIAWPGKRKAAPEGVALE